MKSYTLSCVLVDNDLIKLNTLTDFIRPIPYLKLHATFQKTSEAFAFLLNTPVDLVITAISPPELLGIELYERLLSKTRTETIFISDTPDSLIKALNYSAMDYLQYPVSQSRFEKAIIKTYKTVFFEKNNYGNIPIEVLNAALTKFNELGNAEKDVLVMLAKGNSSAQVAELLFLSKKTIENHRGNIRRKLSIPSDYSLSVIASYIVERLNSSLFV
jgi:DNA-binding NarL/FixJ family response regulator